MSLATSAYGLNITVGHQVEVHDFLGGRLGVSPRHYEVWMNCDADGSTACLQSAYQPGILYPHVC